MLLSLSSLFLVLSSSCYTRVISERFRDMELIIKRYINSPSLLYFTLLYFFKELLLVALTPPDSTSNKILNATLLNAPVSYKSWVTSN